MDVSSYKGMEHLVFMMQKLQHCFDLDNKVLMSSLFLKKLQKREL